MVLVGNLMKFPGNKVVQSMWGSGQNNLREFSHTSLKVYQNYIYRERMM